MLQKSAKTAPAEPAFSHADMQMIVQVLANQPLQNLQAAHNLNALIQRFTLFCAKSLGPTPPAPPPAPAPKAGK